jgi:hypothetical protein
MTKELALKILNSKKIYLTSEGRKWLLKRSEGGRQRV